MNLRDLFSPIYVGFYSGQPLVSTIQPKQVKPSIPVPAEPKIEKLSESKSIAEIPSSNLKAVPAVRLMQRKVITRRDFENLNPQESAALLIRNFGDELIDMLGASTSLDVSRPIELLFRLEEQATIDVFKAVRGFSKGEPSIPANNAYTYYANEDTKLIVTEMKNLLSRLGLSRNTQVVALSKLIPSHQELNISKDIYQEPAEILKITDFKGNSRLTEQQSDVIDGFVRLYSNANNLLNFTKEYRAFLGLIEDSGSSLSQEELDAKVEFLKEYCVRKIKFNFFPGVFNREWNAYRNYISEPQALRDHIDSYVSLFEGSEINSFLYRNRIAKFLEKRNKKRDLGAVDFIDNLKTLKEHGALGTGVLFGKVEKLLRKNDTFVYGLYYEPIAALSLVESNRFNIVSLSADGNFSLGNKSGSVNDIDIVAQNKKSQKQYFIEVKYTVNAAGHSTDQISNLVKASQDFNAMPVLLAGNIKDVISAMDRALNRRTEDAQVSVLSNMQNLHDQYLTILDIVESNMSDSDRPLLRIWDEQGNDYTDKILALKRQILPLTAKMAS